MNPRPGIRTAYRHMGHVERLSDQRPIRAWMSAEPEYCQFCDRTIGPGSLFTLHGTRAQRHGRFPACWMCQPFLLPKTQRAARRSARKQAS